MDSNPNNKIILVGDKNSGKTSIFSMIFTNIYPSETSYFESTNSISKSQIIFSGGELVELDDCGFEEKTNNKEYYIKPDVFENVSTLIFVINVESQKINTDNNNINNINSNNINNNDDDFSDFYKIKKNNLFELINKREALFEEKKQEINQKLNKMNLNGKFFATSIWDGSLYVPWREIMSNMVINKNKLEKGLSFLLEASDLDEVFLFERNTLLCIYSVDKGKVENKVERTKKISILIKKIKQSLRKCKAGFSFLKMRLNNIMVYIEEFTKYSYIMILSQNPKINYELLSLNIYILRKTLLKNS